MRKKKDHTLINFMKEFFPYAEFKKAGIFGKEMKGDYKAQSERICRILGLDSIYEYGKNEIRCHITYANPDCPGGMCVEGRPKRVDANGKLREEPFITIIPSIWNDNFIHPIDRAVIDGSKYDENDEEDGDGDADSPVINKPPKITC